MGKFRKDDTEAKRRKQAREKDRQRQRERQRERSLRVSLGIGAALMLPVAKRAFEIFDAFSGLAGTSGRRLSVKRSRRQRSGGVSAAGVAAFAGGVAVGLMKTRADAFKHQVQQKVVNGEAGSRELAAQIFVEEVLEKNMKEVADVLLSEGLAVVYTQGGAKFDGRRSKFLAIEREARERKLGFWGIPEDARETPAEYKKRKRSE